MGTCGVRITLEPVFFKYNQPFARHGSHKYAGFSESVIFIFLGWPLPSKLKLQELPAPSPEVAPLVPWDERASVPPKVIALGRAGRNLAVGLVGVAWAVGTPARFMPEARKMNCKPKSAHT